MASDDSSPIPAPRTWRDLGLAAGGALLGGAALLADALLRGKARPPSDPFGGETGRGNPSAAASQRAVALRFEPEDMDARIMAWLALGLAVCVAISVGAMFVMLNLFNSQNAAEQPHLTTEETARITPPLPHLQADPVADLHALRARADHALNSYAWLDPAHSHARIPIARAMALTVGTSLDGAKE